MSNEALTWAFRTELPMTAKFVLVCLADKADESDSCFPGQDRIAREVGASVRTVRRALIDLEERGYIARHRRSTSAGLRTSDRYVLDLNFRQDKMTGRDGDNRTPEGDNRPSTAGSTGQAVLGTLREPSVIEPSDVNALVAREDVAPTEDELFEGVWQVYLRNDGKQAARRAYTKALTKIDAGILLGFVERYSWHAARAIEAGETRVKFLPHFSSWLNGERWNDDPAQTFEIKSPKVAGFDSSPSARAQQVMEIGARLAAEDEQKGLDA